MIKIDLKTDNCMPTHTQLQTFLLLPDHHDLNSISDRLLELELYQQNPRKHNQSQLRGPQSLHNLQNPPSHLCRQYSLKLKVIVMLDPSDDCKFNSIVFQVV